MSTKLPSVQQVSVRARNSRGCFKPLSRACLLDHLGLEKLEKQRAHCKVILYLRHGRKE